MSWPDPVTGTTRGSARSPRRDAAALSAAAQERAWVAIWRRLLQSAPDDRPASELHTVPEDEEAEAERADIASA
jgi:hypothetical protein